MRLWVRVSLKVGLIILLLALFLNLPTFVILGSLLFKSGIIIGVTILVMWFFSSFCEALTYDEKETVYAIDSETMIPIEEFRKITDFAIRYGVRKKYNSKQCAELSKMIRINDVNDIYEYEGRWVFIIDKEHYNKLYK